MAPRSLRIVRDYKFIQCDSVTFGYIGEMKEVAKAARNVQCVEDRAIVPHPEKLGH
jgi:hypothetical protein